MDSDDDYNSGMSSQGEGFEDPLQDSAEDSLEEGVFWCKLSMPFHQG